MLSVLFCGYEAQNLSFAAVMIIKDPVVFDRQLSLLAGETNLQMSYAVNKKLEIKYRKQQEALFLCIRLSMSLEMF